MPRSTSTSPSPASTSRSPAEVSPSSPAGSARSGPDARTRAESKIDRVARQCIFRIGTGAWAPGQRLPSTREGARLWAVSPLTVMRAYQRLVEMGLASSSERSGFYVAPGEHHERLTRDAVELDRLYPEVLSLIGYRTDLAPVGVLRRLLDRETERLRREPICAFVECTMYQASGHARELEERLGMTCLALTTDDLARDGEGAGGSALPGHVHVLLTTAFHIEQVAAYAHTHDLDVCAVPIEQDEDLAKRLAKAASEVLVLSLDADQARLVADGLGAQAGGNASGASERGLNLHGRASTTRTIDRDVAAWLGEPGAPRAGRAVLLSTTLWTSVDPSWRDCAAVQPYAYRVCASAWPDVAAAVGLPFGAG